MPRQNYLVVLFLVGFIPLVAAAGNFVASVPKESVPDSEERKQNLPIALPGEDGWAWRLGDGGLAVFEKEGQREIAGSNLSLVRRVYIGDEGKHLLAEEKLAVHFDDLGGRVASIGKRDWNLRVVEDSSSRAFDAESGAVVAYFDLSEPLHRENANVMQWVYTGPTGAAKSLGSEPRIALRFARSGVYSITVFGRTDWDSPFEITQPTSINLE